MAVKKGQYAKVMMDVDGTPVQVMKLREWSISTESQKLDSTAAQQDWETHEIGFMSWEGEATCIDADTFWFAYLTDKVTIDFYDAADDLAPAFTGTASLDVERSVPHDNLIETSISFTGDGALELGVAPTP
jgi:hypothetical protein